MTVLQILLQIWQSIPIRVGLSNRFSALSDCLFVCFWEGGGGGLGGGGGRAVKSVW